MLFATAAAERRLAGAAGLDAIGAARRSRPRRSRPAAPPGIPGSAPWSCSGSAAAPARCCWRRFRRSGRAEPPPRSSRSGVPQRAAQSNRHRPSRAEREPKAVPAQRRHPLRFVWQMDAAGRFFLDSEEFAVASAAPRRRSCRAGRGPSSMPNSAIDPAGRVARAVASRETWSNILVSWPVDGSDERLEVELSGLPAFDRSRAFLGYRGFGVCRDVAQIERLAAMRQLRPPLQRCRQRLRPRRRRDCGSRLPPDALMSSPEALAPAPIAPNVVRFPGPGAFADLRAAEPDSPALSAGEHSAFHELARQLTVRLQTRARARGAAPADARKPLGRGAGRAVGAGGPDPGARRGLDVRRRQAGLCAGRPPAAQPAAGRHPRLPL